jgi:hypothetical protein
MADKQARPSKLHTIGSIVLLITLIVTIFGYRLYRDWNRLDDIAYGTPMAQRLLDLLLSEGKEDSHDAHHGEKVTLRDGNYKNCILERLDKSIYFKVEKCSARQWPNASVLTAFLNSGSSIDFYLHEQNPIDSSNFTAIDANTASKWSVLIGDAIHVDQKINKYRPVPTGNMNSPVVWPSQNRHCGVLIERADTIDRLAIQIGRLLEVEEAARVAAARDHSRSANRIYLSAHTDDEKTYRCQLAKDLKSIGYQVAAYDYPFKDSYSSAYVNAYNLQSFSFAMQDPDCKLRHYLAAIHNGTACNRT